MPPHIIRISSQKGGVGKTTIAVNLSVSLQKLGYETLLIDSDTGNPSVGFHIGLEKANIGYKDFVTGKMELNEVAVPHAPSGMHVVPGLVNVRPFELNERDERNAILRLKKSRYQFIVIDTEIGCNGITEGVDEALILTTPSMPSCSSVIRMAKEFDQMQLSHNLAINRVQNRRYEISEAEIAEMYERKTIASIPEDDIVPESIEEKIPAVLLKPKNRFTRSISALARHYAMGTGAEPESPGKAGKLSFLEKISGIINMLRSKS